MSTILQISWTLLAMLSFLDAYWVLLLNIYWVMSQKIGDEHARLERPETQKQFRDIFSSYHECDSEFMTSFLLLVYSSEYIDFEWAPLGKLSSPWINLHGRRQQHIGSVYERPDVAQCVLDMYLI